MSRASADVCSAARGDRAHHAVGAHLQAAETRPGFRRFRSGNLRVQLPEITLSRHIVSATRRPDASVHPVHHIHRVVDDLSPRRRCEAGAVRRAVRPLPAVARDPARSDAVEIMRAAPSKRRDMPRVIASW